MNGGVQLLILSLTMALMVPVVVVVEIVLVLLKRVMVVFLFVHHLFSYIPFSLTSTTKINVSFSTYSYPSP